MQAAVVINVRDVKRLRIFLTPPCATWGLTSGVDHASLIADKTVISRLASVIFFEMRLNETNTNMFWILLQRDHCVRPG